VPLQNINVVNASLELTAAAAIDYSTLLIVDCNHLDATTRATVYTSIDGYSSVVPSGTPLRRALDSAFSSSAAPAKVVVGRSKGTATLTPTGVVLDAVYDFTVTVADGATLAVSHTALVTDTAEEVAIGWKAAIDAVTDITDHVTATVVGAGADAVLTISLVAGTDDFSIESATANITITSSATETAADTITAIREINTDWTYIAATDHTPTYQMSMAAQGALYQKLYVTSTALAEAYAAWDGISTPDANNVPARLKESVNNFGHCMYHHLAANYPECVRITQFTDVKPGRDDFNYKSLSGFGIAQVLDLSRALNGNELYNLDQVYASTVISLGGVAVVAGNRVSTGIRIEAIAVLNYFRQELKRKVDTLFLRKRKLGMNDADLNLMRNVWATFLDSNVSGASGTQALDPVKPYVITLPKEKDISLEDRTDGNINGSVTCYLDASIDSTVLNMTLTYRDPAEG